ncbi:MAG: hypothetical protein GY696_39670 [Gammaproteobacteria bacterium]|nr:hypothetical protein [Gammaproteobacteria bacterium]
MVLDRTVGEDELPPRLKVSVQSSQVLTDPGSPITTASGGTAWTTGGTPAGPHAVIGRLPPYPPPPLGMFRPPPPPPPYLFSSSMGRSAAQHSFRRQNFLTSHPSAENVPFVPLATSFPDFVQGEPVTVQTTTSRAVARTTTATSGAWGEGRPQATSRARGQRDFDDYSLDELGEEIRMLEEIYCERNGTKPKKKPAGAEEPKWSTWGGLPKQKDGGEVRVPGLSKQCEVVSSASRPIMSDFVQPNATSGQNPVSDNMLGTMYEGRRYAQDALGQLGEQFLPPYNPTHVPYFPQNQRYTSQTTPVFQDPRFHSTFARGLGQGQGAGPGSPQVPDGGLLQSRYVSPFGVGEGGSSVCRLITLEKPLLIFNGTRGSEDFERFSRTFEFYIQSRGAEQFGLQLVETWLEGTPLLVFQQFLRDHPLGSFAELKAVLRANFGKPLDARRAVHKLHSVQWREGQSLVQLATEIRDLHYRAHPTLAVEFRESYAGDTFIRCLPEKWQIKLRDSGGATLTEYLASARDLENRDTHKTEIQGWESSQRQSSSGRSARIQQEPPVGGPQSGMAVCLDSEFVGYCAEGGVQIASGFSSPQIQVPLDIEGVRVVAAVDSGSDINIISVKCF